ncbi:MAG: PHP domain-containing protein, partial [Gemmatimonadota bacterium]
MELHAHSAFSFGDGASAPEALVRRAAELGYGALALTDHADLGGVIRFALEAERAGIRPVVGAELLVDGYPAVFLAMNQTGYRNLASLVTRARVGDWRAWMASRGNREDGRSAWVPSADGETGRQGEWESRRSQDPGRAGQASEAPARSIAAASVGPPLSRSPRLPGGGGVEGRGSPRQRGEALPGRGRPALTFTDLLDRSTGLYALTGGPAGEVASLLRSLRPEEAAYVLSRWRELFPGRLAIEAQLHHVSGEESALAGALIELAGREGLPWVASNEPRYLDGDGRLVHDLLTALRAGLDVNTAASWGVLHPNGEWRLKSPEEMAELWRGREEGLATSAEIAASCGFDLRWLRPPLPHFPVPAGDDDSWLRELTFRGARERWGELDERQRAQLEHELGVIARLGFAGFFLVMWDAVRFARERRILCQGRGSAANSAVAYCLGFEMHRREEVLDYMYDHYGRAHSAITAVTQAFHAPAAVQDAMRALGYTAELAFRISKRLHHVEPAAGADALEAGLAAKVGLDLEEPRARALLAALRVMDDVPRLRSTHPGGFVLSSEPLGDYMPIEETSMGRTILQFDKDDLDAAGVPKFDFLGLGGLSVVHLAFDAIKERTGDELALYRLPVDDPATYDMIAAGDTVGTFQIESRAQIQSIVQTRPERLYDIVVQVALIRPGPIQARFVQPYTRRRRGLEEVVYDDPRLEPIVRRTYGIPIFQEQAMAISMALGGFSAAEADELRRAMGHHRKLPKLHAALQHLKVRMSENGVAPETAEHIVEDLYSFANYGFPESHAWSFALIAYATAYLKRHYPAEFFMGLLNAWPMGFYPPATLVHQARRDGVEVRPPCLRDGDWDCSLEPVQDPVGHGLPRLERHRHQQTDGETGRQGNRGKPARAALAVAERDARYAGRSQGERAAHVAVTGNDACDREGENAREAGVSRERGGSLEERAGGSQKADVRRAGGGTREPNPRTGGLQDHGRAGRASGVPARPIAAASGAGDIGPKSGLCSSERSE